MPIVKFTLNGVAVAVEAPADATLLWAVRDSLGQTGTKFGCGIGLCGACTLHIDGHSARACCASLDSVAGRQVTTIEGLSPDASHPLQKAWLVEQVPQCGYCQSGQIMQAADLLTRNPSPTRQDIVRHMDGNICRCGTYPRIIRAIERASRKG